MYRSISRWGSLFILVVAVGMYGCSSSSSVTNGAPESTPTAGGGHGGGEHMTHEGHVAHSEDTSHTRDGSSDMQKMNEGLAKLSEADRASAEKQHVCPVSGQMLGTMGAPTKVSVKSRDVWLCCPGCESQLRENPDEYLAKLTH